MPPKDQEREMLAKHHKEMDDARAELRARIQSIKRAQEKQKADWVSTAMHNVMPQWAARQVLDKKRGWLCRLFGVSLDHWHLANGDVEQFMLFKRGKVKALKIFRWDDGQHIEGDRY